MSRETDSLAGLARIARLKADLAGVGVADADLVIEAIIENPEAPAAAQRYRMKRIKQSSGTLLPTLGITFEY